jgi:cytochrome c oxidase subunit 1
MFGGDTIFYQHIFWLFGHPEVYILVLPTFGLLSILFISLFNVYIFGNQSMILAMGSICILGSVVWIHHMFIVTLESDIRAYFTSLTLMISLPTGSKILVWLLTFIL